MSTGWLYFKFYGANCNKALTTVLLNTLKLMGVGMTMCYKEKWLNNRNLQRKNE